MESKHDITPSIYMHGITMILHITVRSTILSVGRRNAGGRPKCAGSKKVINKISSSSEFKVLSLLSKFAVVGVTQKHRRITIFGIWHSEHWSRHRRPSIFLLFSLMSTRSYTANHKVNMSFQNVFKGLFCTCKVIAVRPTVCTCKVNAVRPTVCPCKVNAVRPTVSKISSENIWAPFFWRFAARAASQYIYLSI